jgi:hypothetical protein
VLQVSSPAIGGPATALESRGEATTAPSHSETPHRVLLFKPKDVASSPSSPSTCRSHRRPLLGPRRSLTAIKHRRAHPFSLSSHQQITTVSSSRFLLAQCLLCDSVELIPATFERLGHRATTGRCATPSATGVVTAPSMCTHRAMAP